MRIIAWILLILGVALAGAGGARMGSGLAAVRAAEAPADHMRGAQAELYAAFAAHTAAMDGLRAAQAEEDIAAADDQVKAATGRIREARERIEAYRKQGLWQGSFTQAVHDLPQAIPDGPDPTERLTQWLALGGPLWGLGIVFVVVGAFLARRAQAEASRKPAGAAGAVDFPGSVREILQAIEGLTEQIAELEMDAPSVQQRAELDRVQDQLITPLVDARGQLIARHGTSTFAVYFGAFSAGERNLARTWSALTDGHSVVARDSLQRARAAFEESLSEWDAAEART